MLYSQVNEIMFNEKWKEFQDTFGHMKEFISYMIKIWIGSDTVKARYPPSHWAWYSHALYPEWNTETTNNIAERFMADLKATITKLNLDIVTVLGHLKELLEFWTKEVQRLSQGIVKVRTKGIFSIILILKHHLV